jgi:hypothetical protein
MLVALVAILGVLGSIVLGIGMNKGEESMTKLGTCLLIACTIIAVVSICPVWIVKGVIMAAAIGLVCTLINKA